MSDPSIYSTIDHVSFPTAGRLFFTFYLYERKPGVRRILSEQAELLSGVTRGDLLYKMDGFEFDSAGVRSLVGNRWTECWACLAVPGCFVPLELFPLLMDG